MYLNPAKRDEWFTAITELKKVCYNFFMIDPELKTQLDQINQNLSSIKNKRNGGVWRAFFNGMFGALGYLVGIVLVFALAGWILAKTGLIAPVEQQWQRFQTFMAEAESTLDATKPASTQSQQGSSQVNGSIITLPNGQRVQIVQ